MQSPFWEYFERATATGEVISDYLFQNVSNLGSIFTPRTFILLHGSVLLFHRNFAMALQMGFAYIKVCANTNFLVKFLKIVAQFLEKNL